MVEMANGAVAETTTPFLSPSRLERDMTQPYVNGEVLSSNEKSKARSIVALALRSGKLLRPTVCEECLDGPCETEAHHHDYDEPLDVEWLCKRCHVVRHKGPSIPARPKKVLTAAEFNAALASLGLTVPQAAKRWGIPYRTVRRWADGDRRVPTIVVYLVALETGAVRPLGGVSDA